MLWVLPRLPRICGGSEGGGSSLFHAGTIPAAPSNGDGDPLSQKRSRRLTQMERDAGPRPQHCRCHLWCIRCCKGQAALAYMGWSWPATRMVKWTSHGPCSWVEFLKLTHKAMQVSRYHILRRESRTLFHTIWLHHWSKQKNWFNKSMASLWPGINPMKASDLWDEYGKGVRELPDPTWCSSTCGQFETVWRHSPFEHGRVLFRQGNHAMTPSNKW